MIGPRRGDECAAVAEHVAGAIAERVSGRLRYVIDVAVPGMAHAVLVRSAAAAGRIRSLRVAEAAAVPGVLRVVGAEDLRGLALADGRFGTIVPDQPILASGRVRHVGEPVAAVVAETAEAAAVGAAAVRLRIDPELALLDAATALADGAALLHDDRPGNVIGRFEFRTGDMDAADQATVLRLRGVYVSPAAQQVTLEPQVVVARWLDGALELWATTQSPSRVAAELARVFGLDPAAVRLHVPPLGGGYGAKNHAKLEPLVAALAALVGRPVRLALRRDEEFVTTMKHPASVDIESGVDADGRFTYRRATLTWSGGAYAHSSPAVLRAGALVVCGPYRVPAAEVCSIAAYTNLPPAGSFRGLGANQAGWAGERQVDELARAVGLDPVEFRRRNLVWSGDRLPTGEPVPDAHWRECLDAAVTRLEIADSRGSATPSPRERRTSTGVAVAMKHTMTPSRSEAIVAADAAGRLTVRSSLVDMGQGLATVLARAAARELGVPEAAVSVVSPDTAVTPFDSTTSSSRGTVAGTAAVRAASAELLARVEAGRPRGAARAPGDVLAEIAAAVAASGMAELTGHGAAVNEPAVDPTSGRAVSSSEWHQGAVAVRIELDEATGIVRAQAAHGAAWAGEIVSPLGARLQNEGGLVFGLGPALFEELRLDDGRPGASSLLAYRIPSIVDTPPTLTTDELEAPADGPRSPNGLGESVVPAVAPAIGNALASLGIELRTLPLDPERVLRAIRGEPDRDAAGSRGQAGRARRRPGRRAPATGSNPAPSGPSRWELTVNGIVAAVDADPLSPLRDVLADRLGLRSVRGPCGVGACGACTVLLDGRAVRSCLTPVSHAAGAAVVTSEGLPAHDPVQAAFVEAGAAQCGYCIPGAVLATHALLAEAPADSGPDETAIRVALSGNLCRCGTYPRIIDAIRRVPSGAR